MLLILRATSVCEGREGAGERAKCSGGMQCVPTVTARKLTAADVILDAVGSDGYDKDYAQEIIAKPARFGVCSPPKWPPRYLRASPRRGLGMPGMQARRKESNR